MHSGVTYLFQAFYGAIQRKCAWRGRIGTKMVIFDARLKYCENLTIIAFGPDDLRQNDLGCSTEDKTVRASSIDQVERK